jgi:dihydrofolate synthase/folylpolyglutamate synthase
VLTAAAFDHFRREAVEVAVLEVGMGGRLDATNVSDPVASAIVTVDRDHEAFLGATLAAIAREKAGVLRQGRACVLGVVPGEAGAAIEDVAARTGARLIAAHERVSVEETAGGTLRVVTPAAVYEELKPLPGRHQQDNLVVALRLLEEARSQGIAADLQRVPAGIAATRWPGRLQQVPGAPPLILDGAHNPAAARALAEHAAPLGPLVLLFGAMADKHVAEMARILFPLAGRGLVLTRPPLPRAARPEDIAALAGDLASGAVLEPDPGRALARARRLAGRETPVLVAGSLYLVGDVLRRVQDRF